MKKCPEKKRRKWKTHQKGEKGIPRRKGERKKGDQKQFNYMNTRYFNHCILS